MARQDALRNEVWYHGNISRGTAEDVLREADEANCFLVRDSSTRSDSYVLSVKHRGEIRHFIVCQLPSGLYEVGGTQQTHVTFAAVVEHFKGHPLSSNGEILGVPLPWWQDEDDGAMADATVFPGQGYGQEDSLASQMAAVSIHIPQSTSSGHYNVNPLTQGNMVVLDSQSSGKSLRIVDDEVDGRGDRDNQAHFRVHVRRPGVIALQSVHSPDNWLAIYDGETRGNGTGGPYSELVIKVIGENVIALESVIYAGQHIGILPDGSVKSPIETEADRDGQFLVFSSGLDAPVPEKQLLQQSSIPEEPPPSYDSLHPFPGQSLPQSSHLPMTNLPQAYRNTPGYVQPSVLSSYPSQATPPMSSYPGGPQPLSSGYTVNPRHSYSGPHPQLQPHLHLHAQPQRQSSLPIMVPSGPCSPIGYNIMYIFQTDNIIRLIPCTDPDRYPIKVAYPILQAKGGYILADSEFQVESLSPGTVMLRNVHWAACYITINKKGRIKANGKNPDDPGCYFRVHPQPDNSVCFESVGYPGYYLNMTTSGYAGHPSKFGPAYLDTHFFVRVERMVKSVTTTIMTPFGRPSIVNRLDDRCLIQVYSKALSKYLCINKHGQIDSTADHEDRLSHFIYIDRGMGVLSLYSYINGGHRIRIHKCALQGKGEQNMNSDFYLKENLDGTVCFESVTCPGAFVIMGDGAHAQTNFNLFLLNLSKTRKSEIVTRFQLN